MSEENYESVAPKKQYANDERLELMKRNIGSASINISTVYGDDISELVYNKPDDGEDFEYKLSAIVLVYNGEKYLRPCLDSLVNQTLDGLEIILMNDKSTDDSLSICKEYALNHDNVRIIDKQDNHGLATSANMGIKIARGEYVILVDNDDIIPEYAYEKLYNKAKEHDADISMGKANFILGKYQAELQNHERNVWLRERVIDPKDAPDVFHETFYWNKAIRKSLLIENDIFLPTETKVYADRKFSHTLLTYAKRVSIIPDCVYLWRRIENTNQKSLSMRRKEAWNYEDRINSFELELDKLTGFYKDYFKILMKRVVLPVGGIVNNPEFEEVYFNRGAKLLREECSKMDNVYDNDFNNIDNLYIFLTLNDYRKELKELLELDLSLEKDIVNENRKSYWNLPLFRSEKIDIPDEIFEIRYMLPQFLSIRKITAEDDCILFEGIKVPKYLKCEKIEIGFLGRTTVKEKLEDNTIYFPVEAVEDDDRNIYNLKVDRDQLKSFEIYDIFFRIYYEDGFDEKFRINKKSVKSLSKHSNIIQSHITNSDNLSISTSDLSEMFSLKADDVGLKLIIEKDNEIKKPLSIYLRNLQTNEFAYFKLNEDETAYELEWEFFLDEKSKYTFNVILFDDYGNLGKRTRLNVNFLNDYPSSFNLNGTKISFYTTRLGNLRIKNMD